MAYISWTAFEWIRNSYLGSDRPVGIYRMKVAEVNSSGALILGFPLTSKEAERSSLVFFFFFRFLRKFFEPLFIDSLILFSPLSVEFHESGGSKNLRLDWNSIFLWDGKELISWVRRPEFHLIYGAPFLKHF